ncbi:DUF3050 domain-containing protein [Pendulispora rubella]|uniref:DUF3050 domain-containing protein n=1 Tax=Pendulispora rubella TaxID=2741070 RepID=A0ABZ2KQA7_9BACT
MAEPDDAYDTLIAALSEERRALLSHPIYEAVRDRTALQRFMEAHVFAVWDFMALLKSLQRRLTCVEVAWAPPRSRVAARLVNEIVLGEESDTLDGGRTMSHFELYVEAMREVGARTAAVESYIQEIVKGTPPVQALDRVAISSTVRSFVEGTLTLALTGEVEEVAASFLLGREDLVPAMFRRLVPSVLETHEAQSLRLYLARHIELDEQEHGPMARRLLCDLCGTDASRWRRAESAARNALVARRRLWDGVLHAVQVLRHPPSTRRMATAEPVTR